MSKRNSPTPDPLELNAADLARELHVALFPEEYDYFYDSICDAQVRSRGENPMNAEYVEKTNKRREALGFLPYEIGQTARNENTLGWVTENLALGKEADLRDILTRRAQEDTDAKRDEEQARRAIQTQAWFDQTIDEMLASDRFLYKSNDWTEPSVVAFRVLGELFGTNQSGYDESEFFRQIRRVLPARTETEYQELHRCALNEWMDVYGV